MTTQQALEIAIEALLVRECPSQANDAAIEHLQAMLKQRGCEGRDPTIADGKLTDLCDLVMFG